MTRQKKKGLRFVRCDSDILDVDGLSAGTCSKKIYEDEGKYFHREQCEECHKEEMKRNKENAERIAPTLEKEKKERMQRRWDEFAVEPPYVRMTKYGVPSRIAKDAQKFRLDPDDLGLLNLKKGERNLEAASSFFVFGPPGSGKTVLSAAYLYHCDSVDAKTDSYRRAKFLFVSIPRMLEELRRGFSKKDEQEGPSLVERCEKTDVLVLDDLGVEKVTDWTLNTLYVIIDYRYSREKPTVFTSNLDPEQLADRMEDHRIPSRISGWCKMLRMPDKDLRR